MPAWLDNFRESLKPIGKAMGTQMAPGIAQGFINRLFHQWGIDKTKVLSDVQNNQSLLNRVTQEELDSLKSVSDIMGGLDFITVELVIDSIREDFPLVASLFLGWPEANDWLARQLEDLKSRIAH